MGLRVSSGLLKIHQTVAGGPQAPLPDIDKWFLPGAECSRTLGAYIALSTPGLPPALLDPSSPAPWRTPPWRSPPPRRLGSPIRRASPASAASPAGSAGRPHAEGGARTGRSPARRRLDLNAWQEV